ncbi:leukotriene A-4 hydrolase/aminopeptidase [Batrachochytrium salamandrivorans]|nr:leukotriene A-4 hydrolase/aminopeptidase [Batrachochytrium salamandrivorans]
MKSLQQQQSAAAAIGTLASSLFMAATAFGALLLVQQLLGFNLFGLLGRFSAKKPSLSSSSPPATPKPSSSPAPLASSSSAPSSSFSISKSPSSSLLGEPKQHASVAVLSSASLSDSSSFSNFAQVSTSHLALDLQVDFTKRAVIGHVDLTIIQRNRNEPCLELVLDTRDLIVFACQERGLPHQPFQIADFSLSAPPHAIFGSALRIQLQPTTTVVRVQFSTTPQSSALQWLSPAQTTGKRHPFLFSQSQAIHARSFFPCQDTPGVKFTYEAVVRVPDSLVALMSAVSVDMAHSSVGFKFKQNVPIPAYLVAIVVGELESREISPRSRVWAEPSMVEASQREFALDTERFLSCAEQFLGEYVWGRYDLLVLPNSFPYGGMENPCLVFLTPTLLAGDRSLVNVVAHEIGHCWFGNLVTNASWGDFWLNEGFTVFTERRIIAKLYGEQRAMLQTALGIRHWKEDANRFGMESEFTKLHIEMNEVDPDDSFSSVPYEKGCAFLTMIERKVGGPQVFEPFLRQYVLKFRFGFVDASTLKRFLFDAFPTLDIDWDLWVYAPGIPKMEEEPSMLVEMSETVASRWIMEGKFPKDIAKGWNSWSCDQLVVFMDKVLELISNLNESVLSEMDLLGHFSHSRNCEIRFKWNCINLRMPHPTRSSVEDTVEFVGEQGRMKYVRPLYRELNKFDPVLAVQTFEANREFYHSIAQKMIAKDLGLATSLD